MTVLKNTLKNTLISMTLVYLFLTLPRWVDWAEASLPSPAVWLTPIIQPVSVSKQVLAPGFASEHDKFIREMRRVISRLSLKTPAKTAEKSVNEPLSRKKTGSLQLRDLPGRRSSSARSSSPHA